MNLAARVSGEASGGEVLLTAAALAPELQGVFYESRGGTALRNAHEPVELFAAVRKGEATLGKLPVDPVCRTGEFARHPERYVRIR